ncbi:MAG: response regulator [Cyanobacteriota bacterium]|nr:response regulator [Cyanobacteriota bacterium]
MNSTSTLENATHQLKMMERRKKPKMLVVDDEPDNLDLLYRTFRRDFRVFKADSGIDALDVLSREGEVAVIISDQRMPEMKGTEFLSQTVPQFPDTVRIILTGFTDVEDLVDAINSGQVYKYITKPWDPNELKTVVEKAAETYDLLKQRTEELEQAHQYTEAIATFVKVGQTEGSLEACLEPLATTAGECFEADACVVQAIEGSAIAAQRGVYSKTGSPPMDLENDPLAKEAIATLEPQIWVNSGATPVPEGAAEAYQAANLQIHLLFPVIFRGDLLAMLSLQWQRTLPIDRSELKLMHLCAQQMGQTLAIAQAS